MPGANVGIVTYNGLDGACAAAAVLSRYPDAQLTVTSARRVGQCFEEILKNRIGSIARVYVCGLGVQCDWDRLIACGDGLKQRGVEVVWYCGRGYLDAFEERLGGFCRPVFTVEGTNTGAACKHLGLACSARGRELMKLASLDPNLEAGQERVSCSQKQRFWMDLIEASISRYFKYQDQQAYRKAIAALATGAAGEEEQRLVAVYRHHGKEHALRGTSEVMARLRERIRLAADADEHVMITGESGVGKEYVARLLHEAGRRTMEPLLTVNCAVFSGNEALANSVLFGHVRGAFTGALEDRQGAFASADGGMMFLDELGEMPLSVQGKFLRVIEDGDVTPVGRDRPASQVDVRVIAATNRDLPRMVRDGAFREDLFHRLDVLRIHVPPLREHREDITYIAEHLLRNLLECEPREGLSGPGKEALLRYDWPGNVRQLRKVLKRSLILNMPLKDVVEEEKTYLDSVGDAPDLMPRTSDDIEDIRLIRSRYAARALRVNGNRLSDTARRLHISPNTLKKYLSTPCDSR